MALTSDSSATFLSTNISVKRCLNGSAEKKDADVRLKFDARKIRKRGLMLKAKLNVSVRRIDNCSSEARLPSLTSKRIPMPLKVQAQEVSEYENRDQMRNSNLNRSFDFGRVKIHKRRATRVLAIGEVVECV